MRIWRKADLNLSGQKLNRSDKKTSENTIGARAAYLFTMEERKQRTALTRGLVFVIYNRTRAILLLCRGGIWAARRGSARLRDSAHAQCPEIVERDTRYLVCEKLGLRELET